MNQICLGRSYLVYREGSGNSFEIFNVEVHNSDGRRCGIGKKMVDQLIKVCENFDKKRLYAITRAENRIAQEWYESMNFRAIPLYDFYGMRTIEGHRTVDAIMFVRDLEQYP